MCFKKKPIIEPEILTLPHPEEPVNYECTIENYNLDVIFEKWFDDYLVPVEYRDYWRNKIEIEVTLTIPFPAGTYDIPNGRHLSIRPEWLNAGVIAHEQAHNSYALLTVTDMEQFAIEHDSLKNTEPLIKLLYSINSYGLNNSVEAHAEVYRFLGQQIPERLKQYYPRLF